MATPSCVMAWSPLPHGHVPLTSAGGGEVPGTSRGHDLAAILHIVQLSNMQRHPHPRQCNRQSYLHHFLPKQSTIPLSRRTTCFAHPKQRLVLFWVAVLAWHSELQGTREPFDGSWCSLQARERMHFLVYCFIQKSTPLRGSAAIWDMQRAMHSAVHAI